MAGERGITLIEVVIALVLIGLATIFVLPRLEGYRALVDLRRTAFAVAADLRVAQQLAVSRDANHRWVYASAPSPHYTVERVGGSVVKDVDVPASVTVSADPAGLSPEFTPTGAPLVPGDICLADAAGNVYTISVQIATGRVALQEGVNGCAP